MATMLRRSAGGYRGAGCWCQHCRIHGKPAHQLRRRIKRRERQRLMRDVRADQS